ncbi:MAG TPA: 16S rRNA (guanine(966)-N(2))-methyltransferase RsmD [Candidatus Sulfomarinibacteraceae bacterium]|nr:16S rRNA (guanine(966)-N(2))-methyltransferase RsmD [Candidatus Sulfomarinibacteraceae bacterium]
MTAAPAGGPASAGRVIAGRARGIRLGAPGEGTRPLADRVKQALFAILEPGLPGARVLDLFAGSGAAGIEALSRGASTAVFVERDPAAVVTIRANLERTHLSGPAATVVRADAIAWLATPAPAGQFDLAFVDPPYDRPDLLAAALERLGSGNLLAPAAMVVAKHFWRDRPPDSVGLLASERERRFGETTLTFYRLPADGRPRPDQEDA